MRRDFQKSINSTWWINTGVNKDRIHKVPFSNCNHRLVYLRKWHIQKEIDITNFISLSDNIDATLNFQCFKRSSFYSEIFVICWIESVDPVADLSLTKQIYSVLLNAFEFKEITRNHWSTKYYLKMLLEDGCKYPTPPCALAKILPETTHYQYISYILNKYSFSLYVCARGILGCLLGFCLWAKTLRGQ